MRLISHPILCNYYVTYRCNAKCDFCDIWERPSPYVDVSTVEQNLRALKKLGVRVIDFTGGEPLLHRQIDQLLYLAKDLGFITTLTTNCLLYPKWSKKIKDKVDMLHFSLDAPIEELHNISRGVDCFDFVMKSISVARKLGERPDVIFTVFEHNMNQIEQVYRDICLPNDLVLILNPAFDYNQVTTGPELSRDSLAELSRWGKRKGIYLNQGFIQLRKDGGNHVRDPICKAASSTIVVSPNNELILPCYHLGKKEIPINNNLEDLYRSDDVQKLVALEGRLPECEGCTINCYMQPSFAVEMNKYWWKALPSTIKYNRLKGTWKELLKT